MKIAWVLGWAVPEAWFAAQAAAAIPRAEHVLFAAAPDAIDRLLAGGPYDAMAGYSLGTLLLLQAAPRVAPLGPAALLAPIFAFSAEEQLGGRIARAQVRHLARWLRHAPQAALADFYARAGLGADMGEGLPVPADVLGWGLERLVQDRVSPPLPAGWTGWCGSGDALLNAAVLHAADPAVRVVPGATHHPAALMQAWRAGA